MINKPPSLTDIRHAVRFGRLLLSVHATEQMAARNIKTRDVRHALLTATQSVAQSRGTTLVSGGVDLDGVSLSVAIRMIQPGILVITTF